MDINPPILENCTLLQACEWIAFGWEPMEKVYEDAICRDKSKLGECSKNEHNTIILSKEIVNAMNLLKVVLYEKKLIAYGFESIGIREKYQKDIMHSNFDFDDMYCYEFDDSIKNIDIDSSDISFDFKCNVLIVGFQHYKDIQINFNELKKLFPFNEKSKIIKDSDCKYKTVYMQIMEEVIIEENLSNENQRKKEVLKDIIMDKMKKYNLPESNNLASSMATLIRNPESQSGRKSKK